MNERIRQLAEQAGAVFEQTNGLNDCPQDSLVGDEIEKFAELILRESANQVDWILAEGGKTQGDLIKQHFGVEE